MALSCDRSPSTTNVEKLTAAARRGNVVGVATLLAFGVNPNGFDREGRTPLQYGAGSGSMMIVRMLLAAGADVRTRSPDGYSALHAVAVDRNVSLAKLLMAKGADVNGQTTNGVTPLMAAVGSPYSDHEMALTLIRAGADVNAADARGETVLCTAVVEKSFVVVEELLKRGANPNVQSKSIGYPGSTPLHMAARNGLTEEVRLLLRYDADPTIRNDSGETPLHVTPAYAAEIRTLLVEAIRRRTQE